MTIDWNHFTPLMSLSGGILIGLAATLLLLTNGRVAGISGILGARIFHVLFEAFWYYRQDPWHFFEFWRGGFVSYGAFIGGAIAVMAYMKIRKLPLLDYADFVATAIPLITKPGSQCSK